MDIAPRAPISEILTCIGVWDVHDLPKSVVALPNFKGDYNKKLWSSYCKVLGFHHSQQCENPWAFASDFPRHTKGQWYERQEIAIFKHWDEPKYEFLTHLYHEGFIEIMRDEFMNLKQVESEKVESYVSWMESILKR